jgi:hypothetical protein
MMDAEIHQDEKSDAQCEGVVEDEDLSQNLSGDVTHVQGGGSDDGLTAELLDILDIGDKDALELKQLTMRHDKVVTEMDKEAFFREVYTFFQFKLNPKNNMFVLEQIQVEVTTKVLVHLRSTFCGHSLIQRISAFNPLKDTCKNWEIDELVNMSESFSKSSVYTCMVTLSKVTAMYRRDLSDSSIQEYTDAYHQAIKGIPLHWCREEHIQSEVLRYKEHRVADLTKTLEFLDREDKFMKGIWGMIETLSPPLWEDPVQVSKERTLTLTTEKLKIEGEMEELSPSVPESTMQDD